MKITLKFREGVKEEFELPDRNLLFYAEPLKTKSTLNQEKIILDSLNNPIGTGKLKNLLKHNMNVVILIDDITRPTPTAKILPHLLKIIEDSGVPDSKIKIISAPGTHKTLTTEKELEIKLGKDILNRFLVLNRDYMDESKFINIGTTKSGIPIEIDREVIEADFVIGIGNIIPHISAGWSGGGKIILPGICSRKTTDMLHYIACTVQPVLEILGTTDNIPRLEIEEVAVKVGLIYNKYYLDENQNIQGLFCGDPIKAHHNGVELAEKMMIVPIPEKADILIVSANPCYFDYWQGIKPYTYSHRAIRDGGVLIFLLDGEQHLCGDAPSHEKTLRKYMHYNFEDMVNDVEKGIATDIVGMNVPMYHSMLKNRVKNFIVSNHLTQEEVDILGFERKPSVDAAIDEAFKILGIDAKVGIIPYGGETITRVNPVDHTKLIEKSSILKQLGS